MQTLTMYTKYSDVISDVATVSLLYGIVHIVQDKDIVELTFEQVKVIYDMIKQKELQQ